MATTLDTSLYKLNKNAFAIISDSYAKMPEIAIEAIDAKGSPKQPKLLNQLIEVGALYEQIMESVILNDAGTAIIGIQGENVQTINALLACLKNAAGLNALSAFPTPLETVIVEVPGGTFTVGPPGSILVSNGLTYIVLPPGSAGTVLTSDGAGNLIYSSVVGNGLPAGGLDGQFLIKNSNTSYDVIWSTLTLSMVTDVTASPAEINILDGIDPSITVNELNTLVGINTGMTIQQQLDALGSPALPHGQFFVGDVSNVATPQPPTGDVIFDDAGVFAIQPNVIVNADVSTSAGIMRAKLASGSGNRLVVNNAAGVMIDAASILPGRALVSDANGIPTHSNVTTAVLNFISTLTSNAQTQLDNKLTVNLTSPAQGDMLQFNGTDWVNFTIGAAGEVLTSDGTSAVWGSSTSNGMPIGGTTHQVLRKIDNTNYNTEWHSLVMADITDVVTTATEINLLSGLTVNATQLNYTSGVTSNIQTQLNNKQSRSLAYNAIWVGDASNFAVQLSPGSDDQVLTIVSGAPQWETPSPPGDVSGPGIGNSTDHAIVRWNGTSGNSLLNSGVIIDNSNNITGVASLSSGQIDILNQAALRLHETGSTNYVEIRAFGTMAGNYTITLPAAAPSANTALTYDGADYVWSASGGAVAFTDLTDAPSSYAGESLKLVRVNAGETGLEFVASSGTGTVTSVSGTTNRITITGTPTINPTVDIAATYVGQASITTLGTITTGVWSATNISLAKGGTGNSLTDPNADRIMFWDDSGGIVDWLTVGSGLSITGTTITATGSYTDEQAQDAVGNILLDTSTINFTYDDATPTISAIVINNSIGNAQIRQSAGLSVIGNSTNATANVADITGTNGQVLRVSGTTLGFGSVLSTSITMSTARMLGRTTAGTGTVEEITVQNGLTLASTTLKLGGTLTENTAITGAFAFSGSGMTSYQWQAQSVFFSAPTGAYIDIQNTAVHTLTLGNSAGVVLNIGSDAPADMYYRNSSGKFDRLIIGSVGQSMIVSDAGLPVWSNLPTKDVAATTYLILDSDNGKHIRFTSATGCTVTIPTLLPNGFAILCYRADGAGTVSFSASVGVTLEGVGTTIPTPETSAALYHRGSDFIEITGAVTAIGSGTVTSVDAADITGFMTASGVPIVTVGTITYTLDIQNANKVFAGPDTPGDPDATPTFRYLVLDDEPNDEWVEVSGITHTLLVSERMRNIWVSNAAGCTITVPPSTLVVGYSVLVYRGVGAGTVTFTPGIGVTLEGVATTISVAESAAVVMQRNTNVFVLAGSLGTGGGGATAFIDLTDVPSSYSGQTLKAVRVNAGETGLEFFTISGTGTVTSVSGTTNRTTITGTPTINPTVDIAATYVGQTSITTLGTIATGVWQGTSISTSFTDAKVISVSGTTNRITIGGTATVPTVNIHTSYVGQATITTLGTITTGVWTGTAIAAANGGTGQTTYTIGDILQASASTTLSKLNSVATGNVLISGGVGTVSSWGKVVLTTHVSGTLPVGNGGTGISALGTANQVFAVNNAATANEYKTLSLGTTAQSNDLGWVLTGANAIVLHVPDASATVRGVVTTGTQSFAGAKTFSSTLTVGSATNVARLQTRGANNGIAFLAEDDAANRILELGETSNARYAKLDLGSDATGDIYYRNSSGNLTRLGVGTNTHVLTLTAGLPVWAAPSGGGGGITNSAANTELMISDGTNAVGTKLYSSSNGALQLGDGSTVVNPVIEGIGSTGSTIFTIRNNAGTSALIRLETGFTGIGQIDLYTQLVTIGKGSATQAHGVIRAEPGDSSANNGVDLQLYGGAGYTTSGNGNGGHLLLTSGAKRSGGAGVDGNITLDQLTGNLIVGTASGKLGFFNATAVVKQTSGANLTNNVTSGGTNDQIDDFTSLTVYATDAAAIRNAIYQLSRKLKMINDGLRTYGLFT